MISGIEPAVTRLDTLADHPSMIIGSDGLGLITYDQLREDPYSPPHHFEIVVAHCNDVPCSSVTLHAEVENVVIWTYAYVAMGPGGLPMIVYEWAGSLMHLALCLDHVCSRVRRIDGPDTDAYYYGTGEYKVTLGADGNPLIAYMYRRGSEFQVWHCAKPSCRKP